MPFPKMSRACRWVLLTGVLVQVFVSGWVQARHPNILFVVADDLGYSDLGCYGGEIQTPQLDRLAREGVRFTQFYNMGRCCPSRATILTGRYPHAVGLGHMTQDIGHPGYRGRLTQGIPTLAEWLAPHGYRSFISGKWHLGTPDPTQHGFEEFYGTLVSAKRFFDPEHLIRLPASRKARTYPPGEFYATDAVTDHALDFLQQARATPDRPWFLYLAYHAPHFPLQAPREEIQRYEKRYLEGWDVLREERLARMKQLGIVPESTRLSPRSEWVNYGEMDHGVVPAWKELPENRRRDLARRMAIYAAMVDRMDQQLGRVFHDLQQHGEWRDTLIVFLSDNGACAEWDPRGFDHQSGNENVLHEDLDAMGQPGTFHSAGSGWANASNTPWRLYKHFNHEGGINSPCIVHWPARLSKQKGSLIETPSHIIDLVSTALAATGHSDPVLEGTDLVRLAAGSLAPSRDLFFEHEGNRAIRSGDWKLVAQRGKPWELYHFEGPRTEGADLAARFPERVQDLAQRWKAWATGHQVTPLPEDYGVAYLRSTTKPNQP